MKHLLLSLLCLMMSSFCFAQQKTLDDYLQVAVKNSPLLKDLNNQILSAQLDSVRIKAGLKPQVSAGSAGLYAPVIHGYGYSQAITNGQTLDALLSVNKSFISNYSRFLNDPGCKIQIIYLIVKSSSASTRASSCFPLL